MREIKFRFWDARSDEWCDSENWLPSYPRFDVNKTFELALKDGIVVQQYTGLKDKNGVEIYEGDILSLPKDSMEDYIVHAIVKYGTGEFDGGIYKYPGFYLESTGDDVNLKEGDIMEPYEITNLHYPNWYHYEVVGNIFEGIDK